MPKIQVADILIEFNYVYPNYFEDLLKPYLVDDENVDHQITVHVLEYFDVEKGLKEQASFKNRHVYESKDEIHIVAYDDNGICKQYVRHSKDYKVINIYLNSNDDIERLVELEYVLTGLLFVELALFHKRLAIHSSAIDVMGEGILFSASSGTGKSTHTLHWIKEYNAMYINDDKPLVYKQHDKIVVSGTPWCGKELLQSNITVPLRAIVFLDRGDNNLINMANKEKVIALMQNSIRPRNEELMNIASEIINDIVSEIPMVKYQASINSNSTKEIYSHIFGGNYEN